MLLTDQKLVAKGSYFNNFLNLAPTKSICFADHVVVAEGYLFSDQL